MQDPGAGLTLGSYSIGTEQYKMCFTGKEIIILQAFSFLKMFKFEI